MMLRKNFVFFIIIFLLVLNNYIFSVKIYVANLNVYRTEVNVELTEKEQNATALLYKFIKKKDFEGILNLQAISNSIIFSDKLTKSTLDASELCELLHIDYLIYGFIEKTSTYYNAEVRLFENDTKKDKKIFYVKNELGSIDEVLEELSLKIKNYLYDMLGFSEYFVERKAGFGGIGIYNSVGYWFPLSTKWWDIMTGLICFETGVNVMPITPIAKARNFKFDIRYGFLISYSLGLNKPGYLRSYFNSLIFKIPAEFCFEIFFNHDFIVGFGPQLQLDILYQKKLFDDPKTSITVAFSLLGSVGYEYWFGKKKLIGIGVNNVFDFTFYNNMFIDYKLELYTIVRISIGKKDKEKNKIEIKKIDKEEDLKNNEIKGNENIEDKENQENIEKEQKEENDSNIKPEEKNN